MTLLAAWGITQWVIVLVIALLLFGGSRLAGLGKGVGRSIREFKEEVKSVDDGQTDPDAEIVEAEIVSSDVRPDPVDSRLAEIEARERQLAEREAELQRQREAGAGS